MEQTIKVVIAGNHSQYREYIRTRRLVVTHEPNTVHRYIERRAQLAGLRFSDIVLVGDWYEDKEKVKLWEIAQALLELNRERGFV